MRRRRSALGRPGGRARLSRDEDARALPLVNVVFLLLIFFIVAGRIAPAEPFRADPPDAAQDAAAPEAPVEILMAADGRLGFEGAETTMEQLTATLRERGATSARLRADGGAEALEAARALAALRAAGVEDLALIARRAAR